MCVSSVDIDSLDAAMAQDSSVFDISHISDDLLIEESGKVIFLIGLLENLRSERHRCLVFSSSRRMLDIIQKVMQNRVSEQSIAVSELHLTATGNHITYGITQCYLPPGRGDNPAFTPAEAGTRFSDPGGMQG